MEQSESYIDEYWNRIWYLPSKGRVYWHRIDGPAIEYTNGAKAWWIYDKKLLKEEVEKWLHENQIDLETKEDQMAFKLRWS